MHGNGAANLAVQQSDLLIALGARFDDRVTGKLASFAPNAKVLHIDIDNSELNKLRQVELAICASLEQALPLLMNALANFEAPSQWRQWQQHCAELKQQHQWRYDFPGDTIYAPAFTQ